MLKGVPKELNKEMLHVLKEYVTKESGIVSKWKRANSLQRVMHRGTYLTSAPWRRTETKTN